MKNIIKSLLVIVAVAAVAGGATYSIYFDTETSNGNTYTAGTLDLKVNGGDQNVAFTYGNMLPIHSQPNNTWKLKNAGSLTGYLNLKDISVASNENDCNEPEESAGDSTCDNPGAGQGELAGVLDLRLMVDADCDGWYGAGDTIIFNGKANTVAGSYKINKSLAPNAEVCINSLINWPSNPNDNLTQSDDMVMNLSFELNQDPLP